MRGKFDRTYRLEVFTPQNRRVVVEPPFTLRANITRNTLASANTGDIEIINLGQSARNQIYKDRYSVSTLWQVRLQAGYNNRLHNILTTNIFESYSFKQNTDWITRIDCLSGIHAIQNGFTSMTVQKNTPKENYIRNIISDIPNLLAGFLGSPANGQSPRGKSFIGQSVDILRSETDGQFFFDDDKIHVISNDEVLPGQVIRLDPDDLLTTPRRRDTFLDVKVLFQPQVQLGRVYAIESLDSRFNGQYKIVGFNHNIEISGAQSGLAITTLSLYFGAGGLQEVS